MKIGLNLFSDRVLKGDDYTVLPTENGRAIDFAVCHFDAVLFSVADGCGAAERLADTFQKMGIDYIVNFEFQNFNKTSKGPDGFDWANHDDGTHRLELPEATQKALSSRGNLIGMIYDEFEHIIINHNASIWLASKKKLILPAFPYSASTDIALAGRSLSEKIGDYANQIKAKGAAKLAGEHVFPVLYHTFARNGIIPNFKSQKESYTNVQFALAAGAALEYKTELWNCIDSWFMNTNPGHSPTEMYNNLLFAWHAGVNRVYVESCMPMITDGKLNEYGQRFLDFSHAYKGKTRAFDVSDYRPEIGIIRFDDTCWGQCGFILWKKMLFGDDRIKPNRKTREYLRVFHLLTHGETCINGINWGRLTPWSLRKHRSFASMNSTAVFDDRVRRESLESLKLCFLCGVSISPETLADVAALVKENGLTVVTTKRFAPAEIAAKARLGFCEVSDCKGRWIIVRSFASPRLRRLLKPYLGNKNELRLTFSSHEVRMKISPDGNEITPFSD